MKLKLSFVVLALASTACGAGHVQQSGAPEPRRRGIADLPDWITNPPKEGPVFFYSSGEGESRDITTAVSVAEADARNAAATSMQTDLKALDDKFQGAVRGDPEGEAALITFRETIRNLTAQTLVFSRITQRKVTTSANGVSYHAFVLMESDKGTARQALMDRIKADANLFTRFRASPAFTDLEADIKRIDEVRRAASPSESARFLNLAYRSLSSWGEPLPAHPAA